MNIAAIPRTRGSRHRRKRVGRGIGSGHGKTSTRGQKGQRARTGSRKRPGFEGGRNPVIRRFPKRGMRQKATGRVQPVEIINLYQLNRFEAGEKITPERLHEARLISSAANRVKLLAEGKLSKKLTLVVHKASGAAKTKLNAAGGTLEIIALRPHSPGSDVPAT